MKTTTSIKLDKDLKEAAAALATDLGMTLSGVISTTLTQFVKDRSLHITEHPEFNEKTRKMMLQLVADADAGKNLVGPFADFESARDYLTS
jgi:addiction module RelB/DinJ family antitoxin